MWAPLVTCVIGTSSTEPSGHRSCHISRATSPWRALTPLAIRLERSANCVTPNGSAASSGCVRPRRTSVLGVDSHLRRDAPQRLGDLGGGIGVVAGRHRRVGGEHGALADGLEGLVHRRAGALALGARELEAGHGGVALVEVHDARLDAERVQRPHAADAEQRVLAEPHAGVADVQAGGDPAVGEVVLRPVGVEQEQRHAADVDSPHLGHDRALADRDADRQRLAVGPRTSAAGTRSGSVSTQYSCCQPEASIRWRK